MHKNEIPSEYDDETKRGSVCVDRGGLIFVQPDKIIWQQQQQRVWRFHQAVANGDSQIRLGVFPRSRCRLALDDGLHWMCAVHVVIENQIDLVSVI